MSEINAFKTQIEQRIVHALVETNPSIQKMALNFGWKPKTVIARIEKALPAQMEQQMYLALGPEYRILPETLSTILRTFLGERELTIHDVGEKGSILEEVVAFEEQVLYLLDKTSSSYQGLNLGAETASKFVMIYGSNVEDIIDGLDANIEEISIRFDMVNHDPQNVIRRAIYFLVDNICKYNQANGSPDVIEIIDFFRDDLKMSKFALQEEMDFSDDSERSDLERVKELIYGER